MEPQFGNVEKPLVIEVALNGLTTRAQNQNVPLTCEELAQDAIECLRAGASIVHQHDAAMANHEGAAAMAEQSARTYELIYAEFPDALCYPTIAGMEGTIADRWQHHITLAKAGLLRMALVDPGSINYVDLAEDGLPRVGDGRYTFTNADIRWMFEQTERLGVSANIMILDAGYLRMVAAIARAGRLPRGSFIKFGFGGNVAPRHRGLPPTRAALDLLLSMIVGVDVNWAVAVLNGDCVASGLAEEAIRRGGHVRIGLEDYAGEEQPDNLSLVQSVVRIAERCGRTIATPGQAATVLGTNGHQ